MLPSIQTKKTAMTHLAIRQSGDKNIVSIPKSVLKILGLHVGSTLELSIIDHKILLTPITDHSLEDLLANSPSEKLQLTVEDREWLEAKPKGKELE